MSSRKSARQKFYIGPPCDHVISGGSFMWPLIYASETRIYPPGNQSLARRRSTELGGGGCGKTYRNHEFTVPGDPRCCRPLHPHPMDDACERQPSLAGAAPIHSWQRFCTKLSCTLENAALGRRLPVQTTCQYAVPIAAPPAARIVCTAGKSARTSAQSAGELN